MWEKDDTYCKREKYKSPLNNGKMLLDLIDAHTFDFLTGRPNDILYIKLINAKHIQKYK